MCETTDLYSLTHCYCLSAFHFVAHYGLQFHFFTLIIFLNSSFFLFLYLYQTATLGKVTKWTNETFWNSTNVIFFACWKVNKCKRHEKNWCFAECKIPWYKCYLFAKSWCPWKHFLQSNKNSECCKYEWSKWWCCQLPHYILHGSCWLLQPPDGLSLFPRVQFESCWLNDATFLLNMLLLHLTGEKLLQILRSILYRHSWLCILLLSVQIRRVL